MGEEKNCGKGEIFQDKFGSSSSSTNNSMLMFRLVEGGREGKFQLFHHLQSFVPTPAKGNSINFYILFYIVLSDKLVKQYRNKL